jgi:hypothetical protein
VVASNPRVKQFNGRIKMRLANRFLFVAVMRVKRTPPVIVICLPAGEIVSHNDMSQNGERNFCICNSQQRGRSPLLLRAEDVGFHPLRYARGREVRIRKHMNVFGAGHTAPPSCGP